MARNEDAIAYGNMKTLNFVCLLRATNVALRKNYNHTEISDFSNDFIMRKPTSYFNILIKSI